jgi:hypothetical protein
LLAVADLGAFLAGVWQLRRLILDARARQTGRAVGEAIFLPVSDGLRYSENGLLNFGGYRGAFSRTYEYRLSHLRREARVFFGDGRFFHHLDLTKGQMAVNHGCPPDRYRGRYRALDINTLIITWSIQGPRKSVALTSMLTR